MEKPEYIDHDQMSVRAMFITFIVPMFIFCIPVIGWVIALLWFVIFASIHAEKVKTRKHKQKEEFRKYHEYLNNKGTKS